MLVYRSSLRAGRRPSHAGRKRQGQASPHDHGRRPAGLASRMEGVRKVLLVLVGLYIAAAVLSSAAEARGVRRFQCGCEPGCWCKRPGPSLFRWVTPPRKHHLGMSPAEKAQHTEPS